MSAADRVRTNTLLAFLGGAVATVLLAYLAAVFPVLWSLVVIAALHTPVVAVVVAYKSVGTDLLEEPA